jgi:hypothetical protein
MSEDLVNQITLSCLISKNQLQKLNKKLNENTENNRKSNKDIYEDRIKTLFYDLLKDREPDDLLQEVKTGFDFFLDKCIYYFKAVDNNELLEKERSNTLSDCDYIKDDINFEKEERDIERGNYKEEDDDEEEDEDDEDDEKDKLEECVAETKNNTFVKSKYSKKSNISEGVENIQQLPLNWFQNVRQDYKKNKIIPRKKEIIIDENSFSFEKKKI